jgi:hypothetical protein
MSELNDHFEIEIDRLLEKIRRLERKVRELENQRMVDSWTTNPDRSGGAWTQEELDRSKTW